MGLVVLILAMPYFYSLERDNIAAGIAKSELSEIADYTSNTLANLYFLANSTNVNTNLTKQLLYLPLTVQNSFYTLNITSIDGNASKVTASLIDKASISADSWLVPGLKVGSSYSVEISSGSVIANCYRNNTGFYISLGYGE